MKKLKRKLSRLLSGFRREVPPKCLYKDPEYTILEREEDSDLQFAESVTLIILERKKVSQRWIAHYSQYGTSGNYSYTLTGLIMKPDQARTSSYVQAES